MFSHNPEKLEQKAVVAESKGKAAKAAKYRQKAARLRGSNQAGAYSATGLAAGVSHPGVGVAGVPGVYNTQAVAGNPGMYVQQPTGLAYGGAPVTSGTTYTQTTTQQVGGPAYVGAPGIYTQRTPQRYEQNAVKWEQRGNYQKAQKNRSKVWRLQNPTFANVEQYPQFYQNNTFVGYNVPYQQQQVQQVIPVATEVHTRQAIYEQTTRPERIVEVQPIIHREVDAPQVHVIEKHIYETVPSNQPSMHTNQAIVQETVRPRIIEEIQPVVHREVPQTFVERVEQHVTEHITQPTVTTKQVVSDPTVHVQQQGVVNPALQHQGGLRH